MKDKVSMNINRSRLKDQLYMSISDCVSYESSGRFWLFIGKARAKRKDFQYRLSVFAVIFILGFYSLSSWSILYIANNKTHRNYVG